MILYIVSGYLTNPIICTDGADDEDEDIGTVEIDKFRTQLW